MGQQTRRNFLRNTALAGAGLVILSNSRSAYSYAANEKLNVAGIGTGGRGTQLVQEVVREGDNIIALCDVEQSRLVRTIKLMGAGSATVPTPKLYEDYRKLLETEKSLDAVLMAIGSRWHGPLCPAFMKAGKHVYCEKPLVRKIVEAREIIDLLPKCKVVTQYGTHGGSSRAFRRVIEIIQAGLLGQVRLVHMWCDGYGRFPPSHDRPPGEDPVPPGMNWDFWLGPSPWRPFKKNTYHLHCIMVQNWLDFCNGMLAGQGAHTFNLPVRALKLDHPIRVEAEVLEPVKETYVSRGSFRFDFAARGDLAPVTVWWMDGEKYPPEEVTQGVVAISGKLPKMGCLFMGEKGELLTDGFGRGGVMRLKGEKNWRGVLDHEAAKPLPVTLARAPRENHMVEWLQACKGGPPTFTGFDVGAQAAAIYLPGSVSLRLGRPLDWDGVAMKAKGVPEADPLIQKNYRTKWLL